MIKIKHRWKKNKSDLCGSIVLAFDKDGIATVADVGNNRVEVDTYVRFSKGLASVVDESDPVVVKGTLKDEVVEVMTSAKEEPEEEPEIKVEKKLEEELSFKKTPPKKKPTKKK